MALPPRTGIYDPTTNSFVAPNTGTWAGLTSWSSWTNWVNAPADSFTFVTDIVERGPTDYFNLKTDTQVVNGTVTYRVFTSNTGEFNGEETITTITPSSNNIEAFYGKYYAVEANIASSGGLSRLNNMTVTSTDESLDLKFNNLETSALTQTANGAVISLPRFSSAVLNVQLTLHEDASDYTTEIESAENYMVTPIVRALSAKITSKARTGPTFRLRDLYFGQDRTNEAGHIVDARVVILPEQIHDGTNLTTR